MKHEANFQIYFNKWLKNVQKHIFVFKIPDCGYQNPFDCFSVDKYGDFHAWELKQTEKDSIPFDVVVPHQIDALVVVRGKVVIKYPKAFYVIPVDAFIMEKERSKRKSLTEERAAEIAIINVKK